MSRPESNQNLSTSAMGAMTTTTAPSHGIRPRKCVAQNFLLIWLDADIDQSKQDYQNTLAQLRSIANDVNIFTEPDECIDFLTEIYDMKVFLILGSILGEQIMPLIHDIPQLDDFYIFCSNQSPHEQWTKKWTKIKGVYTDIKPICEAVQLAAKQYNQDSIAVSFVKVYEEISSKTLDELEPAYMYTQLFKEILLDMKYDQQSIKDLILFWRLNCNNSIAKQKDIDKFERTYRPEYAITWYTREYFFYAMLNRALRNLEGGAIINMSFFIRDLHQQIQKLHRNQVSTYDGKSFTVYRGQGLLKTNFEKLLKTKDGLMSFNNFLSTSKDQELSLAFAESASMNTNMVGILFKMTIDPSVSSAPFASIQDVSFLQLEEEILFSMHTVFRIGEIKKMDDSLYQVDLQLTADDDQQLRTLAERIRKEVVGETGWKRLGVLLVKIGQFDKAEELYHILLEQTSDDGEKAMYYNQLGYIKYDQGDYESSISYYEKALEMQQITLPPNHPAIPTSYNNIGSVYDGMGQYSTALPFYNRSLEILRETVPSNPHSLATSYNNIARVFDNMGEHSKALSFFEKTLEIDTNTLPPNHPELAVTYNNIGLVYHNMGEYLKALSFYEKALHVRQKTLPPNHPDFTTSYNNIGLVYDNMGEYSKALLLSEKVLEIQQKTLPPNHPDLATSYNNIGMVYDNMGEYSKALSFYEKALEIRQKTLPPNHPDLGTSYNNIGLIYYNVGEYQKAHLYFERAQKIWERSLPFNHRYLQTVRESIENVKKKLR